MLCTLVIVRKEQEQGLHCRSVSADADGLNSHLNANYLSVCNCQLSSSEVLQITGLP